MPDGSIHMHLYVAVSMARASRMHRQGHAMLSDINQAATQALWERHVSLVEVLNSDRTCLTLYDSDLSARKERNVIANSFLSPRQTIVVAAVWLGGFSHGMGE